MDAETTTDTNAAGKELQDASFAALNCKAATEEARKLASTLCGQITATELSLGKRQHNRVKKAAQLHTAVEAFIADLLRAQASGNGWVYRSRRPESFTGEAVGHRAFITVTDMLASTGLLETRRGYQETIQWEPGGPKTPHRRFATRFRATQALIDLCAEHGVRAEDVDYHFHLPLPEHPLQRRAASKRDHYSGKKIRGTLMRYEQTPKSERLEGRIRELNYFLDGKLSLGVHRGYVCAFNKGDDPGFDWNKGGRLYGQGRNYQQLHETERLKLTIEGQPVCEVDIRTSYLTIFHALHKQRMDLSKDPYVLPGVSIPRQSRGL
jgi:hypothetical protein